MGISNTLVCKLYHGISVFPRYVSIINVAAGDRVSIETNKEVSRMFTLLIMSHIIFCVCCNMRKMLIYSFYAKSNFELKSQVFNFDSNYKC